MKIFQTPSPNFSRSSYTKIGVQIHKTLGLMPGTLSWLRNPRAFASAHYLITKGGIIYQLVQLKDRSWTSGRISRPSQRARDIMVKNNWGGYVKPGHYLVQIEAECLLHENYTEKQYESVVWLCNQFEFDVTKENLLTHTDTASYKPDLEKERAEILKRLGGESDPCDSKPLVLSSWSQLGIKVEEGRITLFKKL